MYIVDFVKRMTRKANAAVMIYLFINVFVIAAIIGAFIGDGHMPFWQSLLIGIILYGVSLMIALSPFGEWILRVQNGCKKITREEQRAFVEPIFHEVYKQAKKRDHSIPDDVQLYINDDQDPNAFATGRKTICITEGMLEMPVEQIKATLAHEFGHLAHKDTDLILVVAVGNMIISLMILGIRIFIDLVHFVISIATIFVGGPEGVLGYISGVIYHALITAVVAGLTWVWTQIGIMLVMKSSRENEFEADAFASELGYGNALCALLDTIAAPNTKGLFASLVSSHPDKNDRIAKLQDLGATYRKVYGA